MWRTDPMSVGQLLVSTEVVDNRQQRKFVLWGLHTLTGEVEIVTRKFQTNGATGSNVFSSPSAIEGDASRWLLFAEIEPCELPPDSVIAEEAVKRRLSRVGRLRFMNHRGHTITYRGDLPSLEKCTNVVNELVDAVGRTQATKLLWGMIETLEEQAEAKQEEAPHLSEETQEERQDRYAKLCSSTAPVDLTQKPSEIQDRTQKEVDQARFDQSLAGDPAPEKALGARTIRETLENEDERADEQATQAFKRLEATVASLTKRLLQFGPNEAKTDLTWLRAQREAIFSLVLSETFKYARTDFRDPRTADVIGSFRMTYLKHLCEKA